MSHRTCRYLLGQSIVNNPITGKLISIPFSGIVPGVSLPKENPWLTKDQVFAVLEKDKFMPSALNKDKKKTTFFERTKFKMIWDSIRKGHSKTPQGFAFLS